MAIAGKRTECEIIERFRISTATALTTPNVHALCVIHEDCRFGLQQHRCAPMQLNKVIHSLTCWSLANKVVRN